jgi:hypothetical protein
MVKVKFLFAIRVKNFTSLTMNFWFSGTVFRKEKWKEEVGTELNHCLRQQWPVAFSQLTEIIFTKLVPTILEWTFGAVKIWRCHLG